MMEMMKMKEQFIVVSYGNREKSILTNPTLPSNTLVFIWKEEEEKYKERFPNLNFVVLEPTRKRCIQEKRYKVHNYCIEHNIHKYWIFDDDFKSFTTLDGHTSDLSLLNNISLDDQALVGFDVSGFAYLLAKDGKYKPFEKIRTAMICSYMGVNIDLCDGLNWSNEDVFEDVDFIYRLYDRGIYTYKLPIKANTYYTCNSKNSIVKYDNLYQNTFEKYGDRLRVRLNKYGKLFMTGSLITIKKEKEGKLFNTTKGDYTKLYDILKK